MERSDHKGRHKVVKWLNENGVRSRNADMSERDVCISFWDIEGYLVGLFDMWKHSNEDYLGFEVLGPMGNNNIDSTIESLEDLIDLEEPEAESTFCVKYYDEDWGWRVSRDLSQYRLEFDTPQEAKEFAKEYIAPHFPKYHILKRKTTETKIEEEKISDE